MLFERCSWRDAAGGMLLNASQKLRMGVWRVVHYGFIYRFLVNQEESAFISVLPDSTFIDHLSFPPTEIYHSPSPFRSWTGDLQVKDMVGLEARTSLNIHIIGNFERIKIHVSGYYCVISVWQDAGYELRLA
jgi:hypothetical protein